MYIRFVKLFGMVCCCCCSQCDEYSTLDKRWQCDYFILLLLGLHVCTRAVRLRTAYLTTHNHNIHLEEAEIN